MPGRGRTSTGIAVRVTPCGQTQEMSGPEDDPVPPGLVLSLDEAFRVLEALEDSLSTIENAGLRPGLVDELATVIRIIHGSLGLDEGGLR